MLYAFTLNDQWNELAFWYIYFRWKQMHSTSAFKIVLICFLQALDAIKNAGPDLPKGRRKELIEEVRVTLFAECLIKTCISVINYYLKMVLFSGGWVNQKVCQVCRAYVQGKGKRACCWLSRMYQFVGISLLFSHFVISLVRKAKIAVNNKADTWWICKNTDGCHCLVFVKNINGYLQPV